MKNRKRTRPEVGFTFLELLIAVVILVVVIVAILQLFDQDVAVSKQQNQVAEMQQNLRAAMDLISRDVRAASSCATIPALYPTPANVNGVPFRVPLPISLVWMPNAGTCPSNQPPCPSTAPMAAGDNRRPDGLGLMRCISNGVVDVDGSPSITGPTRFKQGLGLQQADIGKFLLFWEAIEDDTAVAEARVPFYFTAEIVAFPASPPLPPLISGEQVTLGGPIRPTDNTFATFGKHWTFGAAALDGRIQNFDTACLGMPTCGGSAMPTAWKCAMVEWVEYIVDKWGTNDIPHSYSATTKEGSQEHPLLVRRVNPHLVGNDIVPEWDVIAHNIEDLQVVWIWDPDGDVATDTRIPGENLEYQAGDPTRYAEPPNVPGFATAGLRRISEMTPGLPVKYVWKHQALPSEAQSPANIRKLRVTLLARTRERDLGLTRGDQSAGRFSSFPAIESTPNYLQGSAAIPAAPPTAPLYLTAYRRRALTSELTVRNYFPGGLN